MRLQPVPGNKPFCRFLFRLHVAIILVGGSLNFGNDAKININTSTIFIGVFLQLVTVSPRINVLWLLNMLSYLNKQKRRLVVGL